MVSEALRHNATLTTLNLSGDGRNEGRTGKG